MQKQSKTSKNPEINNHLSFDGIIQENIDLSDIYQAVTTTKNYEIWCFAFCFQSSANVMKQTIETKLAVEREERLENEKKAKQEAAEATEAAEAGEAAPASLSQEPIKKKKKKKQKKKNTKPVPQLIFV